jgi:hypothetical protein
MQGIEIRYPIFSAQPSDLPALAVPAKAQRETDAFPPTVEAPLLRHDAVSLERWLDLNA